MAVRGAVRLAGAAAVAVLIGLVGTPAVDAQEEPAAPAEPTAPATPSIRDALLGRSEAVSGIAEGGFGGGETLDVTLTLQNLTGKPLTVVVPRGSLFETEDESQQVAVTVGPVDEVASTVKMGVDPTITLEPGENVVELTGFCAQRLDSGPSAIVPMTWAGVAEAPLTTVVTNIAAQQPETQAAQHAVWWVTDVPVIPVPAEVEPLLEGVDTDAFAASPHRVVQDERYTPQWSTDQPIDAEDPFGESPFTYNDPDGGASPFAMDDGSSDGTRGFGFGLLWMVGLIAALAVVVGIAKTASRSTVTTAGSPYNSTPPGWHPDPRQPGQLRYWNGTDWTTDTRPSDG